jgi:hypothetical protein
MDDNISSLVPLLPFMHNPQLTFISNHNYGNAGMQNPFMTGPMQIAQLNSIQQGLVQTQKLLLEQRKVTLAIAQEAQRLLGNADQKAEAIQIENKNYDVKKESIVNNAIDASYEIIQEEKEKPKMTEKEDETYEKILQSIKRQADNNRELPYILRGTVNESDERVIASPIIFTVRNELWRERVRFALKESCYDAKTDSFYREPNQINWDAVFVLLYTDKRDPEEILLICPFEVKQYLYPDDVFKSIVDNFFLTDLEKLLIIIKKKFDIALNHYFFILEPIIDDKSPYVLSKKDDKSMKADIIKIKPVFSFKVKEQRITFDTAYRSVMHKKLSFRE